MVRNWVRIVLLVILLAGLSTPVLGQDPTIVLNFTARTMGMENVKTLQYSGSGSIYDEMGQHMVMPSYSRQMDLSAMTTTVKLEQRKGSPPVAETVTMSVTQSSPWDQQYDFWLTPYGFIKGAMAHNATAAMATVDNEPYRKIEFMLPGNHKVTGYINKMSMVEKVELSVGNNVLIEGIYHDYADFGGLKVPTIMIRKRAGKLLQVLIVKDAKPGA